MAQDVKVPTLGESVAEATVGEWLKQPGDAVAVDEPIASLETDKVAIEDALTCGRCAENAKRCSRRYGRGWRAAGCNRRRRVG